MLPYVSFYNSSETVQILRYLEMKTIIDQRGKTHYSYLKNKLLLNTFISIVTVTSYNDYYYLSIGRSLLPGWLNETWQVVSQLFKAVW